MSTTRSTARAVLGKGVGRLLGGMGYQLVRSDKLAFPPDLGGGFRTHFDACRPFTLTSAERMYSLQIAVRHVVEAGVPGDLVECGVWRGGSSMLMARVLLELSVSDRRLYLYDTFAGMSEPSLHDGATVRGRWREAERANSNDWCYAPLDEVRRNMAATGYPAELIEFVEGKVEESIPARAPEKIALLRLDTDWYESTRHELIHLYPRLSPGGVLIIDDYGHWEGARKAVDEYFAAHGPVLLHRVDRTARVAQKPSWSEPGASG